MEDKTRGGGRLMGTRAGGADGAGDRGRRRGADVMMRRLEGEELEGVRGGEEDGVAVGGLR